MSMNWFKRKRIMRKVEKEFNIIFDKLVPQYRRIQNGEDIELTLNEDDYNFYKYYINSFNDATLDDYQLYYNTDTGKIVCPADDMDLREIIEPNFFGYKTNKNK